MDILILIKLFVKIYIRCYYIDMNGGLLPTGSSSPDYIDPSLCMRNLTERGREIMLTITDLIAVISLCVTFYSLCYVSGKHDAKTEK